MWIYVYQKKVLITLFLIAKDWEKSPNVFKYYKDTFLNIHKIKLRRGGKNTQNYTKKILMTWRAMMVWSLT